PSGGSWLVMSGVIAVKVMIAVAGGTGPAAGAGWGVIMLGVVAGLATGVGWGLINGVPIPLLDLPPLSVTLGSFGAALGLSDVLTGGIATGGVPNQFASTIGAGKVGP